MDIPAKEMFEKMGFKKNLPEDPFILDYTKVLDKKTNHEETVLFDLSQKEISTYSWILDEMSFLSINKKLLKAINKQVEELKELGKW